VKVIAMLLLAIAPSLTGGCAAVAWSVGHFWTQHDK